jgi:hypothetical protein
MTEDSVSCDDVVGADLIITVPASGILVRASYVFIFDIPFTNF